MSIITKLHDQIRAARREIDRHIDFIEQAEERIEREFAKLGGGDDELAGCARKRLGVPGSRVFGD